jgi:hypothetical protein
LFPFALATGGESATGRQLPLGRVRGDVWGPRMSNVRFSTLRTGWPAIVLGMLLFCAASGCDNGPPGYTETEAKTRLTRLLRLYQLYVDRNRKGPANEQALREFAKQLTSVEKDEYLIGDDVESIFTSSRDNQPFVIKYNLNTQPGGETRAVAWEAVGQGGRRYVALNIGYVEEYDEETFQQYNK